MRLQEYINSGVGNATRLAADLEIGLSYLSQLASGHRRVSPALAVRIENFTGGQVTRAELRPDDYWLNWPDLARAA